MNEDKRKLSSLLESSIEDTSTKQQTQPLKQVIRPQTSKKQKLQTNSPQDILFANHISYLTQVP